MYDENARQFPEVKFLRCLNHFLTLRTVPLIILTWWVGRGLNQVGKGLNWEGKGLKLVGNGFVFVDTQNLTVRCQRVLPSFSFSVKRSRQLSSVISFGGSGASDLLRSSFSNCDDVIVTSSPIQPMGLAGVTYGGLQIVALVFHHRRPVTDNVRLIWDQ